MKPANRRAPSVAIAAVVRVAGAGVLTVAAWAGCAPVVGPVDVEAVVPVEGGSYGLETATLEDVEDLFLGASARFDVRAGVAISIDQLLVATINGDELSFEDMITKSRSNPGWPPSPSLLWNPLSGRYEAEDFDSLYYLTLMESFEEVFRFYDEVAGDKSGATHDRGLVGFYGTFVGSSVLPIPLAPDADNAAYITLGDAWLAMRVHDQDGIPFGMNRGVIAHEFQHRHFFQNVIRGAAYEAWRSTVSGGANPEAARSTTFMRGVDEGLADLYAVGMTGDPAFILASFADAPLGLLGFSRQAQYRDLESAFADDMTFEIALASGAGLSEEARVYCGGAAEGTEELVAVSVNPYCLGTATARMFWDAAGRDQARLQAVFLPAITASLPRVGEVIGGLSAALGFFAFSPEILLEAVAIELGPGEARDQLCAEAEVRFSTLLDEGLVPACL